MSLAPKLKFFKQQRFSYLNSDKRLNIWDGPVRSGKTYVSIAKWIRYIGSAPPGDLIMTGKTNAALYRNVIRPMQEMLGDDMRYTNKHDNRVVELWDREIFCFGANDERSEGKIRGGTFAGGYGDEITLWPESYFTMMLSRFSIAGAQFFGTTNPDNPAHWLKEKFINRAKELSMRVFNWPIDANVNLPKEYIEALKKEYVGLWYKRYILGLWCVAEGAIYDFFDEKRHVGKINLDARYHLVSVDYGTGNPTSFGLYGVNPYTTPKVWRKKGYWWDSRKEGRQKTDDEYAKDMKEWLGDIRPLKIICDPSAASFKLVLSRPPYNYVVVDAVNNVIDGIRTQATMLQTGQYMISDDKSNEPCIKEYYGYVWDGKAAKIGEDKPVKKDDHTKDEERYLLETEFGEDSLDYTMLTRQ